VVLLFGSSFVQGCVPMLAVSSKVSENGVMNLDVAKIKKIKLLIMDVDGVLTDCRVFMDAAGEWRRFFSIRDGYGLKLLMEAGYKTAIITGSKSKDIQDRARTLKIDYFYEGTLEKLPAFEDILKKSGLKAEEAAFIGDDVFDIPVLERVGFAATVPEAMEQVNGVVHYTARRPAGNGAVREICELILRHGALARA
jgi:3-deoxy-D-manno-octulosonate 8-phosphate phosphatase (KDO 8-P phosphatase)